MMRAPTCWKLPSGNTKVSPKRVEALRDVAREIEVLTLVVADRNALGLVEEDVDGHQDGVREEGHGDERLMLGLLFELRHPAKLTEARHRAQQPRGLGMRGYVALDEHR